MKFSEYEKLLTDGLSFAEGEKIMHEFSADTELSVEEKGALLGRFFEVCKEGIKHRGDEMREEWLKKGLTKEQINAAASCGTRPDA